MRNKPFLPKPLRYTNPHLPDLFVLILNLKRLMREFEGLQLVQYKVGIPWKWREDWPESLGKILSGIGT
jgi:hypothetical protein